MAMIDEFKAFAVKGNVIDMAVGIVIGTAFSKIVSSFVADVIMPPIGLVLGGVDFSDLVITLKQATETNAAVTLNYGSFIQTVVHFLIIAFSIFMALKVINSIRRKEKESVPVSKLSKDQELLTEIRDLLHQRSNS